MEISHAHELEELMFLNVRTIQSQLQTQFMYMYGWVPLLLTWNYQIRYIPIQMFLVLKMNKENFNDLGEWHWNLYNII